MIVDHEDRTDRRLDRAAPTPPGRSRTTPDRARRIPQVRSTHDAEILRSLVRRIDPNDAGAHNNLGVVYYQKGLHAEAIERFERALDIDPRMEVARRNLEVAYFHTGYFDELEHGLLERLEADPEDLDARRRLARAYAHTGEDDAAAREWAHVVEQESDDPDPYLELARVEDRRGEHDAALARLREAETRWPDDPRIRLRIGELCYQRGMTADARVALERAVEIDADLAPAYHLLAFVYGDAGEQERAAEAAERAAELNPSLTKSETNLSLDRYNRAQYAELVGERATAPEVAAGTLAHYNLGLAFRRKGLYDEAARELAVAREQGEDELLVGQAEAELFLLRGASEEAASAYADLVEADPRSPKLWNERGVAAHQTGDVESAEAFYERALELDGEYTLACNNLAVVRHQRGDVDGARGAFRAAFEGERAPTDVWCNLGLMLMLDERPADAREAYRRGLALDDESAIAWSGLGAALMKTGAPEEARDALVRAIDIDPELAEARYQLAFTLSALGDYRAALHETERALELDSLFPEPRFRLLIDLQYEEGRLLAPDFDVVEEVAGEATVRSFDFRPDALDDVFGPAETTDAGVGTASLEGARRAFAQGRIDDAERMIRQIRGAGGAAPELLLLDAEILMWRGFAGEALERFDRVLEGTAAGADEGGTDAEAVRRAAGGRARALLQLDRFDEAATAAERFVGLAPDDAEPLRLLGDAWLRAGRPADAVAALEEARGRMPERADLLAELGAAYAAAGDRPAAEARLRRALELDDATVAARAALGRLLMDEDRLDDAAEELLAALETLPSYSDAAFALVELERRRARPDAAVNVLVDFLMADPYDRDGLVLLGDVLAEAGRVPDARDAFRRVLRIHPGDGAARAALQRLSAAGRATSATAPSGRGDAADRVKA